MDVKRLEIADVMVLTPRRFGDDRGFFEESWNQRTFYEATGLDVQFVQDNQSLSRVAGTVRGLHFQAPPHAQAKLIRVARGAIFDVAVDIRTASPTFGQWAGAELSEENGAQLFVPRGFAHGFATLRPDTVVCYKADGFYSRDAEGGVAYDDPDLAIDWRLSVAATLSDKDRVLPPLKSLAAVF